MQYRKYHPQPPAHDLETLSDEERKFSPRVWDLHALQKGVDDGSLEPELSVKAGLELISDLGWRSTHVRSFFLGLKKHHYYKSEWAYIASEPKVNGFSVPYACDIYLMGFNKGLMKEAELMRPSVYFKFTVKESSNKLLIATCHPEKDPADRRK